MKKRIIILILVVLVIGGPLWFLKRTIYEPPKIENDNVVIPKLEKIDSTTFRLGNNWLRKNEYGNWECYVEGPAYERGVLMGVLLEELIEKQEAAFVKELEKTLPNTFFRGLMRYGLAWFNRDLDKQIDAEYVKEIYGVSKSYSDKFNFVGPKFNRVLNYHAAHDIGHMAQNMNLVACSAAAEWQFTDSTSQMLVGRNFDFYFGDDFAKDKIILFCNPEHGQNFVSVTWGGFCGVVSGMNEAGLTVTLNALPSEVPSSSSTPVSIIAREVLQYATTIDEAFAIVKKYNVFVSESFTIVSAKDKMAAVIEKTPEKTEIYYPSENRLIVTNHFQSDAYKNAQINLDHIATSESEYRYSRMEELLNEVDAVATPDEMLAILRNHDGVEGEDLGLGNAMALNQFLAHHAVIFDPINLVARISNAPYQENVFSAYSLKDIDNLKNHNPAIPLAIDSLQMPADDFYLSPEYNEMQRFRTLKLVVKNEIEKGDEAKLTDGFIEDFIAANPGFYEGYKLIGDYYFAIDNDEKGKAYYRKAMALPIGYKSDFDALQERVNEE